MNQVIGFIGSGNMGSAMVCGMINAKIISANQVILSDLNQEKLNDLKNRYGIETRANNCDVAKEADILVLAVKPQFYSDVIKEIKNVVNDNCIIVVIAAGQKIEKVRQLFERHIKVVRVMPNTPALVGEGMAAISPCPEILPEELNLIVTIFNSFGKSEIVPEKLMDAVTAVSGSAPAYVYMLIEAMADGAVREGMPRDKAYTFAAQTVLGSAKMVLETKEHPGKLKDMVCSPGGTTIEGVAVLEKTGLRASVLEAMKAVADKSKEMSN